MRLLHRRIWFRLSAGAAAAVAAATVVAISGTAHAAAGGADLAVSIPGTTVVQDAGKPFVINLHNNGPDWATGIRLIIDTSRLDTSRLFVPSLTEAGCAVDDATGLATCPVPDLPPGGNYNGYNLNRPEMVVVMPIGESGPAGSFSVSVESDTPDPDLANNQARTDVNVTTGSGIDLVAWAQDVYSSTDGAKPIQPGQTGQLLWTLWNHGSSSIEGVEYTITLPPYLTFDPTTSGCDYERAYTVARCTDKNVVIGPGEWFADGLIHPIVVKLAANAPGPGALTQGVVTGYGIKEYAAQPAPLMRSLATSQRDGVLSTAEVTKLKSNLKRSSAAPATTDADPGDNNAPFSAFTAPNPADLSVSATPVSGHVGDTVDVKLTVKNAGPADVLKTKVTVTAPTGTEVTSADDLCTVTTPGKEYACELGQLPKDGSGSATLKVKIVSATVTDGKVEVSSAAADSNPGDNTAPIKVTVLDGAGVPSAEPSAPAVGGVGGGLPVTGTGGLPVTGTQTGLITALGLGVAAVGSVLMVLARRRREVIVPPTD